MTRRSNILADVDDDVGSHPVPAEASDSNGSNWGDAAYTVFTAALGEINDKVNFAATGAEILDALIADAEYSAPSTRETFEWRYDAGNEPLEANNCTRFFIKNYDYESTIDVDVTFRANSNAESRR